tara:strand:+ start:961 stop:1635 length:675 start_codon:yes stop_codon:yes gene_type:complete
LTYLIQSAQSTIHPDLEKWVRRAQIEKFNKPIRKQSLEGFDGLLGWLGQHEGPIILDSGCGTGHSTLNLAQAHPKARVIGFDQSAERLKRAPETLKTTENAYLFRAEAVDLWRLLAQAQVPIERHCLFYPNPWPKIGQVKRRFHAHPVFPVMANLSQSIELRASWLIYAQEFAAALTYVGKPPSAPQPIRPQTPISLFEKKYIETDTDMYQVTWPQGLDPTALG